MKQHQPGRMYARPNQPGKPPLDHDGTMPLPGEKKTASRGFEWRLARVRKRIQELKAKGEW